MFVTHITFRTESAFCVLSFPSFKIDCLMQSLRIARACRGKGKKQIMIFCDTFFKRQDNYNTG